MSDQKKQFSPEEIDRIIQMAWEDRTPFDAIQAQFGLSPGETIHFMRSHMKSSSFRMWRKRTAGRTTKHQQKRGFKFGRFRCPSQRG
ncbi:MAG: TIGR03643 family protein [Planctomycetota bacterium]